MNRRWFLLWLPMMLIAILNGGLRENVWNKYFNDLAAHQISTILLILLCALYIGSIFRFLQVQSRKQALVLGLIWMLLTVGFEFTFGLAMGHSWEMLFHDYNILQGRLWLLFLISLFILPYIFYTFKNNRNGVALK